MITEIISEITHHHSTPENITTTTTTTTATAGGVLLGVAVVGGLVYAVGGFNGSLRIRTVDVYDPVKDCWSSVASMEARRSTLGAAVLNGCIYAIGGFDGSSGSYPSNSSSSSIGEN